MNHRQRLVRCLESLVVLLEERSQAGDGEVFVSAQQPLGEIATALWHLRRGPAPRLWSLALLLSETSPLATMAARDGWVEEYRQVLQESGQAFETLMRVRYSNSEDVVALGDHVAFRLFFRTAHGRVVYLPGVSTPSPEIDFGGLFRVGVQVENGPFVTHHVDPGTLEVKKGVRLVKRDAAAIPARPSDDEMRRDA